MENHPAVDIGVGQTYIELMQKFVAIAFTLFIVCAASAQTSAAPELVALKAKIMSADYRADINALSQLRDQAARLGNDHDLGYLANYWSGYASWRAAINGANHDMKVEELKAHLQRAATALYSSIRLKDNFADAYAAASMVNSWLGTFSMGSNPDMVAAMERLSLSRALFSRANALEPDNPRVLWAKGSFLLFAPAAQGGSIPRAIDVYQQMIKEADRRGVDATSPLPDWGKPEALMSLAFAHSQQTPPDLKSAAAEATAALKLVPEWSYVRDDLMPKIEKQMRAQ